MISWILRPSHRGECAKKAASLVRLLAARRAAMPYAQGFDPLLIVAQIGSMQALWYLTTN